MADYVLRQNEQLSGSTRVRYRDMGDGTHALVMFSGGTATVTGSAVTMSHNAIAISGNTPVLAANANRKYALFINDSANTMYLSLAGAAALNQGIRLNANGGSYEMSSTMGNLSVGAVYANCAVGSQVLLVTEGV
jgi:hypothetical protein